MGAFEGGGTREEGKEGGLDRSDGGEEGRNWANLSDWTDQSYLSELLYLRELRRRRIRNAIPNKIRRAIRTSLIAPRTIYFAHGRGRWAGKVRLSFWIRSSRCFTRFLSLG